MTLANKDTGEVKVWKDVTWKAKNYPNRSDFIQLEFKTKDPKKQSCHKCGWIQFAYVFQKDKAGKEIKICLLIVVFMDTSQFGI